MNSLHKQAVLSKRGSAGAAGYDLAACDTMTVPARGRALVPTGLSIMVPDGTYGRIAPRSGLALKNGIDVGAGVIDGDYRGPVGVILFNFSDTDFKGCCLIQYLIRVLTLSKPVEAGDRIAQLILEQIAIAEVEEVDELDATKRGAGGFGSTGVSQNIADDEKINK